MSADLDTLQGALGYDFRDQSCLVQALTHRSFGVPNNERLEFLGDAILDLLIGELLYHRYPQAAEGDLSRMRAHAVCGENLALIGRRLDLGCYLRLGAGEAQSGGRERESSLANAVEAIVAAVFLDAGLECCRRVVLALFADVLASLTPSVSKDAKTVLQEYLQARQKSLPHYRLAERSGQDHAALFHVVCELGSMGIQAGATASSRKKAEQMAAAAVLNMLESRI